MGVVDKDPVARRRVLDRGDVQRVLARLAHEIVDRAAADARGPLGLDPATLAIVGVRTGGAHLATRLAAQIGEITGRAPPVGLLDITLYRDDVLLMGNPVPQLRGTEVPFDLEGRAVILVDDVLYTGRTVRAALEALLELGRPACVRLAVLVDRGLRELPVAADFVGRALETRRDERVRVCLTETGADDDEVVVEVKGDRRGP
ncbi:MAG: bifunctional pyr operon transcriptional regulator/uracil phosphoribosyltransferase PyrR [Deltaproteobacteria bacterium]|nr:bifunctional pyr operon transcriptional regulator/uracil phosphoribosyltransferase PyrR [Deltaproteobacteria bacterium]